MLEAGGYIYARTRAFLFPERIILVHFVSNHIATGCVVANTRVSHQSRCSTLLAKVLL